MGSKTRSKTTLTTAYFVLSVFLGLLEHLLDRLHLLLPLRRIQLADFAQVLVSNRVDLLQDVLVLDVLF
jgi:hypothetical protein